MGAGAGFKTFVTGDVLTAADTNGYLMQGTWVFADAAARTAAVTSPQEGNMSYLKDTNSTEYYSGSAWVAVGGAGMTLITPPVTLSGASTTIGSISQSYKTLVAFIYGMTNATADGIFRIAINGNTSAQAGVQIQNINNTPSGPSTIGGNTYLNTVTGLARTNSENSFQLTISNYTNIGTYKPYLLNGYMRATTPGDMYLLQSGAYQDPTVAITSLVFSNAGGNFSTGTVKLYGVN
jgi:hypothetical protein